ncbi:MAG: membrane protein insertion efficiency factor YidD [Patescibacteria group bacterium]
MKEIVIQFISLYQKTISPDHQPGRFFSLLNSCRFYPSCSEYSIRAINKYGLAKGLWKSFFRILRCGPWSAGGVDFL